MDQFEELVKTLSLTMGVGWASGINLYAAVGTLGILGATGNITLPPGLEVVQNPVVIMAAAVMYAAEFVADKIPGVDNGWDTVHTFIRVPVGAMLAAQAVGEVTPAVAVAAGLLGGGLATTSHATKAGARVVINTSPEPFSNWVTSVSEDLAVIAGIWTALHYPLLFIILLLLFIAIAIWLLPKIWRGIKRVFRFLGRLLGLEELEQQPLPQGMSAQAASPPPPLTPSANQLEVENKKNKEE